MPVPAFWRANGLKIFISDLLYPGEPSALLAPMTSRGGLSLILAPTLPEEATLPETGNVRLKNCESGATRNPVPILRPVQALCPCLCRPL